MRSVTCRLRSALSVANPRRSCAAASDAEPVNLRFLSFLRRADTARATRRASVVRCLCGLVVSNAWPPRPSSLRPVEQGICEVPRSHVFPGRAPCRDRGALALSLVSTRPSVRRRSRASGRLGLVSASRATPVISQVQPKKQASRDPNRLGQTTRRGLCRRRWETENCSEDRATSDRRTQRPDERVVGVASKCTIEMTQFGTGFRTKAP
jgi:hypothetical protein